MSRGPRVEPLTSARDAVGRELRIGSRVTYGRPAAWAAACQPRYGVVGIYRQSGVVYLAAAPVYAAAFATNNRRAPSRRHAGELHYASTEFWLAED